MDKQFKRRTILNMIKATFEKAAIKNDTISHRKLITEIIKEFNVSIRAAQNYISELVFMGTIKENGDLLWHTKEKEIRESVRVRE